LGRLGVEGYFDELFATLFGNLGRASGADRSAVENLKKFGPEK
jgi:hypothetical protein